jgi:two-component system invasion response regulator UvrY
MSSGKRIRVFLADDHPTVRFGIRHLLQELGGFEVVGEAENGAQVLSSEALGRCDVLVLDLSLPRVGGTEVLLRVRERWPFVAIVVHSMFPEDQFARRALAAGAVAYVCKDRPPSELVAAVQRAARGARDLSAGQTAVEEAEAPHERLSAREHQVFMRLATGSTVAEIASELDVHSCTVSNHLAKIRKKLGVSTVAELVTYAIAEGLLPGVPFRGSDGRGGNTSGGAEPSA